MSGYSPTWTSKGSDHLRALQTTKILLNSLYRIISLFDLSVEENKEAIIETIGTTLLNFFTPNRELELETQFDLLAEFLGWKTFNIEREEGGPIIVSVGGNRFLQIPSNDPSYVLIVSGVAKALGYLIFQSDVTVEPILNQFQTQQIQVLIKPLSKPIPEFGAEKATIEINQEQLTRLSTPGTGSRTEVKIEEQIEVKASIEIDFNSIFSPILREFPTAKLMPIFHQVLSEVEKTFFNEMEDSKVRAAKMQYTDEHIKYLIEFILSAAKDSGQDIREIANMAGKYVIKAYKEKNPEEDLKTFLSKELTSTIARRVAYLEFPARAFCTYAPGEKCVENKRDLCDFVLYVWEGMLSEIIPEKNFKLGARIPATRRGRYCLAEFLKS